MTTNGQPQTLREARTNRRILEEKIRTKSLERTEKLLESCGDYWGDWFDSWFNYGGGPGDWSGRSEGFEAFPPISTTNDRRWGRNYPIFQTTQQLALLRGPSRILCATNPYAIGLVAGLTGYVIGTGFTYRMANKSKKPKKPQDGVHAPDQLLLDAGDVIEEFEDRTYWPEWEQELFWRCPRDGESILRHFATMGPDGDDGYTEVRIVEPEQLLPPNGGYEAYWSFGVRTDEEDTEKVIAYSVHYKNNPGESDQVDPRDIVHTKYNVDRTVKRGMPDFTFSTYEALVEADKLRRNMTQGAAVQAAIAGIREHEAASAQQVTGFVQNLVDFPLPQSPAGPNNYTGTQRMVPGTILDQPRGTKWVPPPGAENAAAHVEVLQACLRGAGMRWNAPEWLVSGLHDTSSFASSLTAENPFVIRVVQTQNMHGRRYRRTHEIVLQNAARAGRLPGDVLKALTVQTEPRSPEVRNKLEEAQANAIRVTGGWKSRQTIMQEEGLDVDAEQVNIDEWNDRYGSAGADLPMPGENDPANPFGKPPQPKTKPSPVPESKDASGHEHDAAGRFGSGGGSHSVDLPIDRKKATVAHVEKALDQMGYKITGSKTTQHEGHTVTQYTLKGKDGEEFTGTAKAIRDKVYDAHQPAPAKPNAHKPFTDMSKEEFDAYLNTVDPPTKPKRKKK